MKKLAGLKAQNLARIARELKAQRQKTKDLAKSDLFIGKTKEVEGSKLLEQSLKRKFDTGIEEQSRRNVRPFSFQDDASWRENRRTVKNFLTPGNYAQPTLLDLGYERASFKPGGENFFKQDPDVGTRLDPLVVKGNKDLEDALPGSITKNTDPRDYGYYLRGEKKKPRIRPYSTKPISAARRRIVYRDPDSKRLYRSQRSDFPDPRAKIVEREVRAGFGDSLPSYIQRRLKDKRAIVGQDMAKVRRENFRRFIRENFENFQQQTERLRRTNNPVFMEDLTEQEYLNKLLYERNPKYTANSNRGFNSRGEPTTTTKPLRRDFSFYSSEPLNDIREYLKDYHDDINKAVTTRKTRGNKPPKKRDWGDILKAYKAELEGERVPRRIPMRDLFSNRTGRDMTSEDVLRYEKAYKKRREGRNLFELYPTPKMREGKIKIRELLRDANRIADKSKGISGWSPEKGKTRLARGKREYLKNKKILDEERAKLLKEMDELAKKKKKGKS